MRKYKCSECGHICKDDEVLKEHHPFKEGDLIWGCPSCLEAESLEMACEVEGCDQLSSCGWPGEDGEYHHTCGKHDRSLKKTAVAPAYDFSAFEIASRVLLQSGNLDS